MSNEHSPPDIPRPDGLDLGPFVGLRYAPQSVDLGRVLAPPYDVIDAAARDRLLALEPHNVVRLTLPDDGPGYSSATRLLAQWRADGVLAPERSSAVYVYEQTVDGHVQRGLVGALGLTPAEDGIVLPHENTMAGPVADRLALTAATRANLEPIFLVYDGGGEATRAVGAADEQPPIADAADPDGGRHRLWAISDPAELAAIAEDLAPRRAVIADGHHRYATYLQYQRDQHAAGAGAGPWDRGLAFLVDAGSFGPQVHAIHRVVPGLPVDRAVDLAAAAFRVTPIENVARLAAAASTGPAFVISDGERHWLLTDPDPDALAAALPADRSDAWRSLHVSVAHGLLFSQVWHLEDREGIVDFVHDEPTALAQAAASGGTAVLLAPTPVAAVAAVAAAGERMPRKSTLFVPKPATGMVIRAFADQPVRSG